MLAGMEDVFPAMVYTKNSKRGTCFCVFGFSDVFGFCCSSVSRMEVVNATHSGVAQMHLKVHVIYSVLATNTPEVTTRTITNDHDHCC